MNNECKPAASAAKIRRNTEIFKLRSQIDKLLKKLDKLNKLNQDFI